MNFQVEFKKQDTSFLALFEESNQSFNATFSHVQIVEIPVAEDVEIYRGTYDVIPKLEQQTLETANKFLQKNVTVKTIPHYTTSNVSGGNTVYIAMEV